MLRRDPRDDRGDDNSDHWRDRPATGYDGRTHNPIYSSRIPYQEPQSYNHQGYKKHTCHLATTGAQELEQDAPPKELAANSPIQEAWSTSATLTCGTAKTTKKGAQSRYLPYQFKLGLKAPDFPCKSPRPSFREAPVTQANWTPTQIHAEFRARLKLDDERTHAAKKVGKPISQLKYHVVDSEGALPRIPAQPTPKSFLLYMCMGDFCNTSVLRQHQPCGVRWEPYKGASLWRDLQATWIWYDNSEQRTCSR